MGILSDTSADNVPTQERVGGKDRAFHSRSEYLINPLLCLHTYHHIPGTRTIDPRVFLSCLYASLMARGPVEAYLVNLFIFQYIIKDPFESDLNLKWREKWDYKDLYADYAESFAHYFGDEYKKLLNNAKMF